VLALIPAIAAAAAGVGRLAGGISSAVNSTRQTNEQVRHNKEVEKQLGSGLLGDAAAPIPIAGKMLSNMLKKFGLGGCVKNLKAASWGNGLYLERGGNGLFLERQGN
jgi:hypothetical protein